MIFSEKEAAATGESCRTSDTKAAAFLVSAFLAVFSVPLSAGPYSGQTAG
jgi:hypothetical protein